MWTIIAFILLGLLLIVIEIIFIPGTTIVGIIGGIIFISGIVMTFLKYGMITGIIISVSLLIIMSVLIWLLSKSKILEGFTLKDKIETKIDFNNSSHFTVGNEGKTISRLNPAVKAMINDKIVEVHTDSEFIDQEKPVKIIRIEDNKIYVKQIN